MTVEAILYLWSHPIFMCMQWKRKYDPKFAHMQWKLPRSAIIIGSTIKIGSTCCACARVQALGEVFMPSLRTIYAISMNYLCYIRKKQNAIYGVHLTRVVRMLNRRFDWGTWWWFDLVYTSVGCGWMCRRGPTRSHVWLARVSSNI
jgi:hypothetical protein